MLSFCMSYVFFLISLLLVFFSLKLNYVNFFLGLLLLLSIGGFFMSENFVMFMIFMESSFILMSLLVLYYSDYYTKFNSLNYFLIYTILSSIPLFFLIFYLNSINMGYMNFWPFVDMKLSTSMLLFFTIPFMVKMPIFPLHVWLPKVHVMAPLFSSMILAGMMLKMGVWGVMILFFFLGEAEIFLWSSLLFLLFSIWILLSLFKSNDLKVFIAYSSVFHMCIVFSSLWYMINISYISGMVFSVLHCFLSPFMFFVAYVLYLVFNTRSMNIGFKMNFMSQVLFIFMLLTNINIPPLPSFFSEVYYFMSGIIFSSSYLLVFLFFLFFFSMVCYSFWVLKFFKNSFYGKSMYLNYNKLWISMIFIYLMFFCFLML